MSGEPLLDELPERVRLRVISLVAGVLPTVAPLPPGLRRVAAFTPSRRARLGGSAIASALEDPEFLDRAGVQVAAVPAAEDDDVEVGARAWIERAEGWQDALADVLRRLGDASAPDGDSEAIERLHRRIAALQEDLRTQRSEHRARLDEARAEHSVLRSRLGEARKAARAAEQERDEAVAARQQAVLDRDSALRSAEADVRRMRSQLEDATAGLSSTRRETKAARDAATVRARLLLETLQEAAAGLQRELGLPTVTGSPGDPIEAELRDQHSVRESSTPLSGANLEQVLSLPRARLIVDGYNVTKSAWESATLEVQRSRLVAALAPIVARTGADTTVVFDAADATTRPMPPTPRGVKVVFSPPGVIADDVIRQLVVAEPGGRVVVVVTSDQEVRRDVAREGARAVASEVLIAMLDR